VGADVISGPVCPCGMAACVDCGNCCGETMDGVTFMLEGFCWGVNWLGEGICC